jgi:hypothetical protein
MPPDRAAEEEHDPRPRDPSRCDPFAELVHDDEDATPEDVHEERTASLSRPRLPQSDAEGQCHADDEEAEVLPFRERDAHADHREDLGVRRDTARA